MLQEIRLFLWPMTGLFLVIGLPIMTLAFAVHKLCDLMHTANVLEREYQRMAGVQGDKDAE
jgi:hypothetical protein